MKSLLKNMLRGLGYHIQGTRFTPRHLLDPAHLRPLEFDDIICRRMFEVGQALNFIQVGVFDGVQNDPLRKYIDRCGWRGVMVEPQSRACAKLRALYAGNHKIAVMNAALDREPATRTLYTIAETSAAPSWVGGLASFDRAVIEKHGYLIPGLADMIQEEPVQCVPFQSVLDTLAVDRLDLLQIDTEGADAFVLSLFPFDRIKPAIVHWEVKHLTMQQREAAFDHLAAQGYRFAPSGSEDMLAVL
jgi:FkbM family methyltransferase